MERNKSWEQLINERISFEGSKDWKSIISTHKKIEVWTEWGVVSIIDFTDLMQLLNYGLNAKSTYNYYINNKEISEKEFKKIPEQIKINKEQTDLEYYDLWGTIQHLTKFPEWTAIRENCEYCLKNNMFISKEIRKPVFINSDVLNWKFKLVPPKEKKEEWIELFYSDEILQHFEKGFDLKFNDTIIKNDGNFKKFIYDYIDLIKTHGGDNWYYLKNSNNKKTIEKMPSPPKPVYSKY